MQMQIQDVLDRRSALRTPGTWQDALEFLCVVSLVGSVCIAYGDWRTSAPVLLLAMMHLGQFNMFMMLKSRALIEITFTVFMSDIVICVGEMAVQYGYVDSFLGTNITPSLVDSKTMNIIKASTLLSAFLVTVFRLRQYWDIENDEQREREFIEDSARVQAAAARLYAQNAAAAAAGGARYARIVKAV